MDTDDDLGAAVATRSVQVLTAVSLMAENVARARQMRTAAQADRDFDLARRERSMFHTMRAAAMAEYGSALDPGWRQQATVVDAARAWNAAARCSGSDLQATNAQLAAEDVLRRLNPAAMRVYDDARAAGVDPQAAMSRAAARFVSSPLTQSELLAAQAMAGEDLAQARSQRATRDIKATAGDEATIATHTASHRQGDGEHSAAADRSSAVVAGVGYPAAPQPGRWHRQPPVVTPPASATPGTAQNALRGSRR